MGRQKRREKGSGGKRKEEETSIKFQNIPGLQDFPGSPVTDSTFPMQETRVQSLVREHKIPHASTKDPDAAMKLNK